jgi:predicted DNA-binding transcriptional regulator YafY
MTELDDGGVELAVTVAGIVEIQPWILSWGGAAEVLEPPELRAAVAASLARAATRYST